MPGIGIGQQVEGIHRIRRSQGCPIRPQQVRQQLKGHGELLHLEIARPGKGAGLHLRRV